MNDGKLNLTVAGREVLPTGLNLAELDLHGGEGLWDEVGRYTRESRLEELVDHGMGGRAAPRIWAIMESPGAGPSAAAAALGVARVLADRGQAVVLLDVDEQEPRLTRWLNRTEQEGWIDMVRFGASLHAASVPLPSDNRRGSVVGVGSFVPTGVTPDEVTDLLGRLRHQADDLVLVLPAKLRSQPWLESAHIRLLCWDMLARDRSDTETIVGELDRMGGTPDALLGFGVEEYLAIQDRLREDGADEAAAPGPVETDAAAGDEEPVPAGEPAPGPDLETEAEPEPTAAAGLAGASHDATPADEARPRRRRSSGVFVFAAAVAVACLVLVGYFVVDQMRAPDEGPGSVATARLDGGQAVAGPEIATPATPAETGPDAAAPAAAAPSEGAAPGDAGPVTPEDEAAAGPSGGGEVTPPGHAGGDVAAPAEAAPRAAAEPAETAPEATGPSEADLAAPAFDAAPFREPVGAGGWALWLFSLPTEAEADREVRALERRGLRAIHRAVEIKDRGRWYRVYTGSFASRDAANAAAAGLKARLDHDWAVPARF